MIEGKTCVKCGSTKRYASGRCGDCARKYGASWHAKRKPTKLCIDCGAEKECQGQGSRGRCEACRMKHIAAHKSAYAKAHPPTSEQVARSNARWKKSGKRDEWIERNFERKLWYSAKVRSAKKGWQFDLQPTDIVIPEKCPILGISLERGGGLGNPSLASLDRIDSNKGYVLGNVWVISWRANRLKQDATLEELEAIVRALRSREEVSRVA